MSPSRSRKPVARARPRSEVTAAVLVGSGIVAATVALVWALRPGPPGVPGQGGLLARQPRATLLAVLGVLALAAGWYWVRRGRRVPRRLRGRAGVAAVGFVVLAGAVAAGIAWPGGLVRHWPKRPKPFLPPAVTTLSTPTTGSAPTTAPGGTTATTAPASGTTTAGSTTATTGGT
jgi:hypothetical protein